MLGLERMAIANVSIAITKIRGDRGQPCLVPLAILRGFALYNVKENPDTCQPFIPDIKNVVDKLALPTLSEDQLQKRNAPITHSELSKTIKYLPNRKSPCPDGFPNEYYKIFHQGISPHLIDVFSKATLESLLPQRC